jgi:hypothetical protein
MRVVGCFDDAAAAQLRLTPSLSTEGKYKRLPVIPAKAGIQGFTEA